MIASLVIPVLAHIGAASDAERCLATCQRVFADEPAENQCSAPASDDTCTQLVVLVRNRFAEAGGRIRTPKLSDDMRGIVEPARDAVPGLSGTPADTRAFALAEPCRQTGVATSHATTARGPALFAGACVNPLGLLTEDAAPEGG